jgi:hypothetical protein
VSRYTDLQAIFRDNLIQIKGLALLPFRLILTGAFGVPGTGET